MTIMVGDSIPKGNLVRMREDGPVAFDVTEFFQNKRVVLFSVPGAFTATCSNKHLPGYVSNATAIKQKQIDIQHIATKENIADIMTKPLTKTTFEYLRDKFMHARIDP